MRPQAAFPHLVWRSAALRLNHLREYRNSVDPFGRKHKLEHTDLGSLAPQLAAEVFNLNGILLFALFITLTLAVLGPFQCIGNPDGSSSMASNPGVSSDLIRRGLCSDTCKYVSKLQILPTPATPKLAVSLLLIPV